MQEVTFHLPTVDNNGNCVMRELHEFFTGLCKTFGGATVAPIEGLWVGPDDRLYDEPAKRITVAVDGADSEQMLKLAAIWMAEALAQEALYWRGRTGIVEIVDLSVAITQQPPVLPSKIFDQISMN